MSNLFQDIFTKTNVCLRCVDCPDQLELCPQCWSLGAQIGTHSPSHAYKIVDNGGFTVLESEWTAKEHVCLLDSVEQFGFGNWEDIAKKVTSSNSFPAPSRAPVETKEEFCNSFITQALGRHSWREDERGRTRDHTMGNPLMPPSQPTEPPANISLTETIMLGYMPKREDFEVEFDNEAETLISGLRDLVSNTEEDDVDTALMVAHVDMYKFKLRERERRKRVSRDHQLVNQFFRENPLNLERKSNFSKAKKKEKTDIVERLKILAEFQGVEEHQAFIASVVKEKELKSRVKDLARFRKNGILHLKESQDYEAQRLKRIKRKNEQRRAAALQAANAANQDGVLPSPVKMEEGSQGALTSPLTSLGAGKGLQSQIDDKVTSLTALPGYETLSSNEKKLCLNLKLTPASYISYKTCLLINHLQKKKGQTPKPLNPHGLDKNNRKIIFNFLMRAGWITAY